MNVLSRLLLFVSLLALGFNASSQQKGVITGTVQNINTNTPIEGVTIMVGDTGTTAITNAAGKFRLSLDVGTYKISARSIGFLTEVKYNIVVGSGTLQAVNFELQPDIFSVKEIAVTYNRAKSAVAADMVTPLSVQQLTTEEIKSTPRR